MVVFELRVTRPTSRVETVTYPSRWNPSNEPEVFGVNGAGVGTLMLRVVYTDDTTDPFHYVPFESRVSNQHPSTLRYGSSKVRVVWGI